MKQKHKKPTIAQEAFGEAIRLYHNGKSFLKGVRIEYGAYSDSKPVQEACAAVYLGLLRSIDGYLLGRGRPPDQLPTSYDAYREALEKVVPHNGKVRQAFKVAYQNLHIFGYYRGVGVEMVREGLDRARNTIEILTGRKV